MVLVLGLGFFWVCCEEDVVVVEVFGKLDFKFLKLEKGLVGVVLILFVGLFGFCGRVGEGILVGWSVVVEELF